MPDYLNLTLVANPGESESAFKSRLTAFWTHLLRSDPDTYEAVFAEAKEFGLARVHGGGRRGAGGRGRADCERHRGGAGRPGRHLLEVRGQWQRVVPNSPLTWYPDAVFF